MPWDIDTVERYLRELVDRALHDHGEPPFPFIRRVELDMMDHRRAMEVRVEFTNNRAMAMMIPEFEAFRVSDREMSRIRDRTVFNSATDFAQLQQILHTMYADLGERRTVQVITERAFHDAQDGHLSWDAMQDVERSARARADEWRHQAMSHSFQGQRRPARQPQPNPYADAFRAAQMQMIRNGFGNTQAFDITGVAPAPNPNRVTAAHQKGRELLWNNITEAQKISLKERGYFEVVGNRSGHTYRIYHGTQQNVVKMPGPMPEARVMRRYDPFGFLNPFARELREQGPNFTPREIDLYGKPSPVGLCFVYSGLVPGDVMLGQKLSIETEEDEVAKVAIGFGVGRDLADMGYYVSGGRARDYWASMSCAPPATAMEA